MNILFLISVTNTLLEASIWLGILWLPLLFLLCLIIVHVARLAKLGWTYSKNAARQKTSAEQSQEKSAKEEKTVPAEQQKAQEPVYYIVERKKKRAKTSYGEPKEIRFK